MNTASVRSIAKVALSLPLILLILLIGLYPLKFLDGQRVGILTVKTDALLNNQIWNIFFYLHIMFGGLALLIGWLQFIEALRRKYSTIHRAIGKVYVLAVWLSGFGATYIVFFAEGGVIAFFGFAFGIAAWIFFTIKGYTDIRSGNVSQHKKLMLYSYATCLAAVTLRIELPLLVMLTDDFVLSYRIVSWISWGANLMVAFGIVKGSVSNQLQLFTSRSSGMGSTTRNTEPLSGSDVTSMEP
ncbi:DUF2306 domain-containing protein [Parachryseolinea silvisoli]|uniref:DUF2306 domain-containing protein n=1 Tax=Parachryseolinea silvisoli TaxID=2873601 RepID=UPI0022658801|nr:DUF2306 domain-containing protein [Parachryseolinea silvisoli]MCD9014896.1 DUF2306 domain-containing protein [Parachryseolinea silvisoli]